MPNLEFDKYYHIYNRGNNRENLFRYVDDYEYFTKLFEKYLYPVVDIYAWGLLKNHFHMLVRIKGAGEVKYKVSNADRSIDAVRFEEEKWKTIQDLTASSGPVSVSKEKLPNPTLHFSHLFNAYARYFNLKYSRTGALFERPFQRIEVNSILYFTQLVVYIHTNPVHHGFTDNYKDYSWSSYDMILSSGATKLDRETVLKWFGDRENFIYLHDHKIDEEMLSEVLIE
jgi:REP element-mobilizing transposase RayT